MRRKGNKIEKNRNLPYELISVKVLAKPFGAEAVLWSCHTLGQRDWVITLHRDRIGWKLFQEQHLTWDGGKRVHFHSAEAIPK